MIFELIHRMLSRQLDRKKQDVVRLRWQQAELQRIINQIKKHSDGV